MGNFSEQVWGVLRERGHAQRAGFLTESMADLTGTSLDLRELEQLTQGSDSVPLASHRSGDGDRNNRWGVAVNTEIEPDL